MNCRYHYNFIYIEKDGKLSARACFGTTPNNKGFVFYVPIACKPEPLANYLKFLNDIGVSERFIIESQEQLVKFTVNFEPLDKVNALVFLTFTRYPGEFYSVINKLFQTYDCSIENKFDEFLQFHLTNDVLVRYSNHSLVTQYIYYLGRARRIKNDDLVPLSVFQENTNKIQPCVYAHFVR